MKPQILVSAPTANSGKTLFAMGLLRVLKKQGLNPQSYKCGPDFIDAQLMSLAADKETVNLDVWMSSHTHVQHLYNKYGEQADVCMVEGVGGLFDGYKRMQGSSAEMAKLLNLPVVLLVNARLIGYSVAPIIYGYKHFYAGVQIVGVVFNQVSSPAHYAILREACLDVGVDCLGYLPNSEEFKMTLQHNALSMTNRKNLSELADRVARQMEKTVDVSRLLNRCNRSFPCQYTLPYSSDSDWDQLLPPLRRMRIAVARDAAFNFLYKENMDGLSRIGKITYFSPLYDASLPDADLIYLPGGYPELFARQLHRRRAMKDALKNYIESGGKVLAECGGMVFLGRTLRARDNGTAYPMCDVFPIDFALSSMPNLTSGYRKMDYHGMEWKGYEYHYTSILKDDTPLSWRAAWVTNLKNTENVMPMYRYKNVIASYTHWCWGDRDILKLWQ